MAVSTLTEHDRMIQKHDRMILRMREIYDRPRTSPLSQSGETPNTPRAKLARRPKEWGLAKWSPPWGWTNVAHFATFAEADRHRQVMESSLRAEGAISHREDGTPLRAYELSINRLRLYRPGGALNYARRVDALICEAQLWAAGYGCSVSSRLENGLLLLMLTELREVS